MTEQSRTRMPRTARSFRRDDFLSIRCPHTAKARLWRLAQDQMRDASNLALAYIVAGIERDERSLLTANVLRTG